jgi:hypothetical protein
MINMVVPHKATGPNCVTVLHACDQRWTVVDGKLKAGVPRLTKRITEAGIEDYDRASLFRPSAWQLECVEDFLELLTLLEPQTDACIIRGVLKPDHAERAEVLRRYADHHGDLAMFKPADRQWLMVEADSLPCPPGVDPKDPELAGGAVRMVLPPEFRSARCVVQLSSGAGIKPGLRVHLWFWLDRPISDAEAKRWLRGAPVDLAVFNPIQAHYVARPLFGDGVDDPCGDGRLAVLHGFAEVEVPDLPDPERPRPVFASMVGGGHHHGGAEAYANACLRRLALAPEGRRHNACLAVSCRLLGLSKAGLLDPVRVAGQIKGVMHGKGMDLPEVNAILEWAWQQVGPEGTSPWPMTHLRSSSRTCSTS